jgi:superfamily II DNA/RNA helicase
VYLKKEIEKLKEELQNGKEMEKIEKQLQKKKEIVKEPEKMWEKEKLFQLEKENLNKELEKVEKLKKNLQELKEKNEKQKSKKIWLILKCYWNSSSDISIPKNYELNKSISSILNEKTKENNDDMKYLISVVAYSPALHNFCRVFLSENPTVGDVSKELGIENADEPIIITCARMSVVEKKDNVIDFAPVVFEENVSFVKLELGKEFIKLVKQCKELKFNSSKNISVFYDTGKGVVNITQLKVEGKYNGGLIYCK